MKKIILFLVVLLSFIPWNDRFHGEEAELNMSNSLPIGINYLDLRYLKHDFKNDISEFLIPIKVKRGANYVLVTTDNFIGRRNGENYDLIQYKISEVNNRKDNQVGFDAIFPEGKNVYYTSFLANDTLINIKDFPVRDSVAGEFMLFEGVINDFEKFVPYIGPREGTEFNGVVFCSPNKKIDLEALKDSIINNNSDMLNIKTKEDNYSSRYQIVGTHNVKYHLIYEKNIVVYNLEIRVMDVDAPAIVGPTILNFDVTDNVTDTDILNSFQFIDNVTETEDLVKEVVYNEYQNNKGKKGSYEAKIKVTDEFDNVSEKVVVVRVGQSFSFVFEGPSKVFVYTNETPLSEADILNKYKAAEGVVDEKLSKTIINNQYNGTKVPGTYEVQIRFHYQETANTTAVDNVRLTVIVVDRDIPSLNIPEMILNVKDANKMTNSEIKDYIANELLKMYPSAYGIEILLNEYEISSGSGTYYVYYQFQLAESTYSNRLTVNVLAKENSFNPLIIVIPTVIISVVGVGVLIYLKKKKIFDSNIKK